MPPETALDARAFIEHVRADGELMALVGAGGLERPVPPCPGWDVEDVLVHTASVYRHKLGCIRLRRAPREGEWETEPPAGMDVIAWFRSSHAAILAELAAHEPSDPAYTWWPPDQTVGFWCRRMAQETVVHRVDVETAFGDPSPVDPALAEDGIDEVLVIFLAGEDVPASADGRDGIVVVSAGRTAWSVRLKEDGVSVSRGDSDAAGARLAGEPEPLFLYLWGRGPLEPLRVDGDIELVFELRRRLVEATQ